tara:strand:- start:573 stop:1097 length:525 start_codon:yes stop_codon:yes gene_type:complete
MIDTLFPSTIRKYSLTDERLKRWATKLYDDEKFNITSPFSLHLTNIDAWVTELYTDTLTQLVNDLSLEKTHVAFITDAVVCVLEKGETLQICNTLPSHYTLTHFIKGVTPDIFYHPARSLLEVFNPGHPEWTSASSLYINEGDAIIHPSYLDYTTPPVEERRTTLTLLLQLQPK